VRVGKVLYMDLDADSADAAVEAANAMCRKLLANPVTEDFEVVPAGQLEGAGS
jgi:phosphoribosylformylglycinamidine (FGAM) synthase PurS component